MNQRHDRWKVVATIRWIAGAFIVAHGVVTAGIWTAPAPSDSNRIEKTAAVIINSIIRPMIRPDWLPSTARLAATRSVTLALPSAAHCYRNNHPATQSGS